MIKRVARWERALSIITLICVYWLVDYVYLWDKYIIMNMKIRKKVCERYERDK